MQTKLKWIQVNFSTVFQCEAPHVWGWSSCKGSSIGTKLLLEAVYGSLLERLSARVGTTLQLHWAVKRKTDDRPSSMSLKCTVLQKQVLLWGLWATWLCAVVLVPSCLLHGTRGRHRSKQWDTLRLGLCCCSHRFNTSPTLREIHSVSPLNHRLCLFHFRHAVVCAAFQNALSALKVVCFDKNDLHSSSVSTS